MESSRPSGEDQESAVPAGLAALLGVGGAAAWTQPAVSGSDLWWHLAAGREIATTGSVPELDRHSHTFSGEPWMNHEWLWDLLYWRVYDVHPDAIAWLNFSVLLLTFAAIFATARRASGSLLAAGAATWLVAAASHWYLDIRPHLVTLLFVALLGLTGERRWAPWLWPPLVALWVNLHAGFVFGLGAIGLGVLIRSAERSRQERRFAPVPAEWIGVGLAVAAALLNPWTWQILEYPLALLDAGSPYRVINEWQPPAFELGWETYAGRFWIALAVALPGAFLARRSDRTGVALAAVSFGMAATSRRFIPLFCVVSAPLMARSVAAALRLVVGRVPALRAPRAAWAWAAVAGAAAVLLWSGVRTQPDWLYRWTAGFFYPEAALRYLQAIGGAQRLLNLYSWGGYVMFAAPEVPVFIDGRALTLYSDALYEEYRGLQDGNVGTRAALDRHAVDAVLFPDGTGLVQRLRQGSEPWVEVYSDRNAVLLLRPDDPRVSRSLPRPSEVLGAHPDLVVRAARRSAERGDFERATERYEAALETNPLLIPVYGELAALAARRGDFEAIPAVIARGRHEAPRFGPSLSESEGRAWEQAGDLELARAALLRARPAGPFHTSRAFYDELEALERRIEWRRSGFQGSEPP